MKHLKNFNQYIINESLSEFDNEDVSKWVVVYESNDIDTLEPKSKKITKYKREDGNTLTLQPNGKWKSSKSGNEYSQAAIDNLVNNHEVNTVTWKPVHEFHTKHPDKFSDHSDKFYQYLISEISKTENELEEAYKCVDELHDNYSENDNTASYEGVLHARFDAADLASRLKTLKEVKSKYDE